MTDEDILNLAKEKFERAQEAENDTREEARDDIRFARLGEQWPLQIKRQREIDNRPCLTINKMPAFIRQVVNDARQNKPGIVVMPADDNADPDTAEIINGLIRNIQVASDADVATDTAIESAVSGGFGYFRINIASESDDSPDKDISFERIANPFTVYGDPDSTAADSSDWNCALVVEPMPKERFEREYKNAEPVDWDAYSGCTAPWIDNDTIMVAEYWHREPVDVVVFEMSDGTTIDEDRLNENQAEFILKGIIPVGSRTLKTHKVTQYLLTGAEVLETVEWPGKYIPIVPVYGDEINCDGKRVFRSLINQGKDAQRQFNYWRTMTTELIALAPKAPYIGEEGSFVDEGKWATANVANYSYLEYKKNAQMPQRQPFAGVPAGALQEALNASDDMKSIIGIYDASLGARSNETSGRAIVARQREGDVSTFHFIDNLSRAIRHAGRIIIDLIPKVYSNKRIVRILGEDMKPKNVRLAPGEAEQPEMGEQEDENAEINRVFDVTIGKYDLIVKSGPSYSSLREETRAELVEIMRNAPESAPILGPMYLRNSDWPGAEDAADKLEKGQGIPPEAQQKMQDMQRQLEAAGKAVEDLQKQASEIEAMKARAEMMSAEADLIRARAELATAGQQATEPYRAVA